MFTYRSLQHVPLSNIISNNDQTPIIARSAYSSEVNVAGITSSVIYGMYHCEIYFRCSRSHRQCYIWYVSLQDQHTLQKQHESQTVLNMVYSSTYFSEEAGVTNSVIYGICHCEIRILFRCSRSHKHCYIWYVSLPDQHTLQM